MSENDFVHLHVHTEYSLLDGLSRIDQLVERAKALNMPAVAITDHGTMFGVMEFYRACKAAEIKPIIGVEAYLARRSMKDKDPKLDKRPYHMLLLAQNQQGYLNLLKIASAAQLDGYYYRPRIDREFLAAHSEGVIATSGCLAAQIPTLIMEGRDDEAREQIGWYQDVFGKENFFLELQQHDIPELETLNKWLVEYGKSNHTHVPLIATNDVHYVLETDYDPHDTLLCIQTSALKTDNDRLRMSDASYHLTSQQEMWNYFGQVAPEALQNTLKVAEMCDVSLDTKGYHLPVFPVPEGHDSTSYLRYLCEKGLRMRYGERAQTDQVLIDRLDFELSIVGNMGFNTYFLIVWDLCQFARHADIWWNVRGSGAGSLVAYSLGITNIDPIQNNLLFERFLNPGRVSMPDIDMDFPDNRREEMIYYTARKYGEDKVAAIITFGTLGAKAAVRDVGRALGVPLELVNQAARLIPTEPKPKPIETYVEENPELKDLYNSDPDIRRIVDTAKNLQGVNRHASTHAAGVIVADKPLVEYLPLHRPTKIEKSEDSEGGGSENPLKAVTQFPMETCESIGLLKIDFLGLSTLSIFRKACDLIEKHQGVRYTMESVPYRPTGDANLDNMLDKAFDLFGRGETVGVFQFESTGMQQMLRDMRPRKYEHIIAAVSLYRPGPMDFIPLYNRRLRGEEPIEYRHPALQPILEETMGILVYQEQLMQVAGSLFGYKLGEADLMRRAVSKKKEKDLKQHRTIFLERGPDHGVDEDSANKIFDDIEFFANYGFNKCLVYDTEIVDADTGKRVQIGDLVTGKVQVERTLTCDLDTLRLQPGKITAAMENGVKPVYRLTTQLGRQIESTDNHPFYTFEGWRMLGELKVGEQIAVPRHISSNTTKQWSEHQIIVLGHLLAEGNLTNPASVYYYTTDPEQWTDYTSNLEKFDNMIASTHQRRNSYDVYAKKMDRAGSNTLVQWIESLGLRNTTSYTKFIPDGVFELSNSQIGLLISRMWEGDGHINEKGLSLFYATSSERMAHQLQHLLLRLKIISRVRRVEFPYKEGRVGYQVFVTGSDNFRSFYEEIGLHFISAERRQKLEHMILDDPQSWSSKDVVPLGVKEIVRREKSALGITWDQFSERTKVAQREFQASSTATKSGFTRNTVSRIAEFFDSDELRVYANNDIYWDKVVSIEYVGEEMTYDLTIEGTHNFIANDILVHNSHAADYAMVAVQTAFLKTNYPAEYMTGMLSVQRGDSTKIATFLGECRRMNIPVLAPDVNTSELDFDIQLQPNGQRGIRIGLAAIKNAGENALTPIVEARQQGGAFKSLEDFCRRVDLRLVQKRALESIIKAGALDAFAPRNQLVSTAAIERLMNFSTDDHKAKEVGQISMFGGDSGMADKLVLPSPENIPDRTMLNWEKELLGLYVSGRPADKIRGMLQHAGTHEIVRLKDENGMVTAKEAKIAGEVVTIRKMVTKNGQVMAVAHVEDWQDSGGAIDVVLFPRTWDKFQDIVLQGSVLIFMGKVDASRGDLQIICENVSQNANVVMPEESSFGSPASSSFEPPAWLSDAPYDEETGEVMSSSAVPEPEMAMMVAPATQGAAAIRTPSLEPQLAVASRDVPNWSAGLDLTADDEEEVIFDDEEKIPERWLMIYFHRSDDPDKDRRRLTRLHGILTSYPGQDRFTIVIEDKRQNFKMEFPNHTTSYCEDLERDLVSIIGEGNLAVFDSPK